MYCCGTFSVTSNSRMMWSFVSALLTNSRLQAWNLYAGSRRCNSGKPFLSQSGSKAEKSFSYRWVAFKVLARKTSSKQSTVWLACVLSFLLGLPSLGSSVAFTAATSIATMGLYISYGQYDYWCSVALLTKIGIPIALRVIGNKRFTKGPFHLGALSIPIALVAVTWIMFISIVFVLPEANPIDSQTLNYTIVAVGIVMSYSMTFWLVGHYYNLKGEFASCIGEGFGAEVVYWADKPDSRSVEFRLWE